MKTWTTTRYFTVIHPEHGLGCWHCLDGFRLKSWIKSGEGTILSLLGFSSVQGLYGFKCSQDPFFSFSGVYWWALLSWLIWLRNSLEMQALFLPQQPIQNDWIRLFLCFFVNGFLEIHHEGLCSKMNYLLSIFSSWAQGIYLPLAHGEVSHCFQ